MTETNLKKLWVNKEYYLLVDEEGQTVAQDTFEGALGYVFRLYHARGDARFAAMKIPKLIASTHRENAYINKLMAQEVESVFLAWTSKRASGILDAHIRDPLRKPLDLQYADDEHARQFHNGVVCVYFEAGLRPKFLILKEDGSIYPDQIQNFPFSQGGTENFIQQISGLAAVESGGQKTVSKPWNQSVYITKQEKQNGVTLTKESRLLNQHQAAKDNPAGLTWHTCLPSVIYRWAYGTFQKAVSLGYQGRGVWSIEHHLRLVRNVADGINTLHKEHLIHADLRPANIVYVDDPKEPRNYLVADYGSLAVTPVGSVGGEFSDETTLDRAMQGERTSVFYAPERTDGKERETADRALLITEGQTIYVVLGWSDSDDLAEENVREAISLLEKTFADYDENNLSHNEEIDSRLQRGDRVKIQDFIFELRMPEFVHGNLQILSCWPTVSKVVNGRIVLMQESPDLPNALSVDRVIEMQQWSAATDIYSLGVLLLYSIYRGTPYDPEEYFKAQLAKRHTLANGDDIQAYPKNVDNEKDVEDSFRQMLSYLTSPPYFRSIWTDLEAIRQELEQNWRNDAQYFSTTQKRIANRIYPASRYNQNPNQNDEEKDTLLARSIIVTRRITQTAPGTRRIVAALNFDLAAFIFIFHFSMACIHRKNYLSEPADWMDKTMPFCSSRLEKPGNGASKTAYDRLEILDKIINDNRFTEFNLSKRDDINLEEEIPEFNPDPDTTILAEKYRLEEKLDAVKTEIEKTKSELIEATAALEYKGKEFKNIEDKIKNIKNILNASDENTFRKLSRPRYVDEVMEILNSLNIG